MCVPVRVHMCVWDKRECVCVRWQVRQGIYLVLFSMLFILGGSTTHSYGRLGRTPICGLSVIGGKGVEKGEKGEQGEERPEGKARTDTEVPTEQARKGATEEKGNSRKMWPLEEEKKNKKT